MLLLGQLGVQLCRIDVRLEGDVQAGLRDEDIGSQELDPPPSRATRSVRRRRRSLLTAEAVIRLVSVLLSAGSTFPATTSSEPLKYLSKRFWVTSDTESSGNWMAILLSRGDETWL